MWVPDLKMEAIKSGETTAAFRQPSDVMVIPETQIYSRFFVTIPVGERETVDGTGRPFKGHVPTATAPCDKNPSKRCRMLPRKTSAALVAHTIEATCDPPICAAKWVGSGVGPPLFGELVGDPEVRWYTNACLTAVSCLSGKSFVRVRVRSRYNGRCSGVPSCCVVHLNGWAHAGKSKRAHT